MIQVLGLCHFVLNQRLYLKWKVKVGSDLSFSLWMFYGNKLSLSSTMGKELDLLPEKPKSLVVFDPTKFHPDWNKSGRRTRLAYAKSTYSDVETALYDKGVARVMLTACVDDGHKVVIAFSFSSSSCSP